VTSVSIIIKALNEEAKIAGAIESALAAVAAVGGEVILADGLSEDRTVEIARRYPVTIAQLERSADRCCGSGPQLGFQHARAEFVYLMDGDMELRPGFLEAALPHFAAEPDLAAVGGVVEDTDGSGIEYRARRARQKAEDKPGYVGHLNCGGLYRAQAIREVGYFSNRNLHSYEEFELGVRLRAAGWKLKRIERTSVLHHVHTLAPVAYLARRWRDRFGFGSGELLRSALGKRYLPAVAKELMYLFRIAAWMAALAAVLFAPMSINARLTIFAALLAAPILAVSVRRKSLRIGLYTTPALCLTVVAGIRGALRPQVDPRTPIDNRILQQGTWLARGSS